MFFIKERMLGDLLTHQIKIIKVQPWLSAVNTMPTALKTNLPLVHLLGLIHPHAVPVEKEKDSTILGHAMRLSPYLSHPNLVNDLVHMTPFGRFKLVDLANQLQR